MDWLAQADYTLPTGSTGKIELGGKATVRILENSYDVQESPSEDGIYTSIPGLKTPSDMTKEFMLPTFKRIRPMVSLVST